MHYAVTQDYRDIVKLLIENGANVMAENNSRQTPSYLAVIWGRFEIVKILIESGRTEVSDNKNILVDLESMNIRNHIKKEEYIKIYKLLVAMRDLDKSFEVIFSEISQIYGDTERLIVFLNAIKKNYNPITQEEIEKKIKGIQKEIADKKEEAENIERSILACNRIKEHMAAGATGAYADSFSLSFLLTLKRENEVAKAVKNDVVLQDSVLSLKKN